jgi:hypothetical protein
MRHSILILLFILAPVAVADFVDGSYKGRVYDVSGNPIYGVIVRVQGSESTGSVTDTNGDFFVKFQTEIDKTTVIEVVLDGYQTYTTKFVGTWGPTHVSFANIVLSSDEYHESRQIGDAIF